MTGTAALRHDLRLQLIDTATDLVTRAAPLLPVTAVESLVDELVADVDGLGPLEAFLDDDRVSDVLVNGPGPVWLERDGVLFETDVVVDRPTIDRIIERILGPLGVRADRVCPVADARLADGSRVHVVVPPVAVDGPTISIRRFAVRPLPLDAFTTSAVAELLGLLVAERRNVVVSGGTGAGKTTLLNSLARGLGSTERIVTVEDAAELRLPQRHVVRLEARRPSVDGVGEVTIRELVRAALRMRPDRIVVGEVRGAEALDMVQAMNTGHDGSLTTCHANSAIDALRRLETLVLLADAGLPLAAVREQLASAVDVVVQVARRPDGRRAVVEVAEVIDDAHGTDRVRPLAIGGAVVGHPTRSARR